MNQYFSFLESHSEIVRLLELIILLFHALKYPRYIMMANTLHFVPLSFRLLRNFTWRSYHNLNIEPIKR